MAISWFPRHTCESVQALRFSPLSEIPQFDPSRYRLKNKDARAGNKSLNSTTTEPGSRISARSPSCPKFIETYPAHFALIFPRQVLLRDRLGELICSIGQASAALRHRSQPFPEFDQIRQNATNEVVGRLSSYRLISPTLLRAGSQAA